jgi:DNA polymerase family A
MNESTDYDFQTASKPSSDEGVSPTRDVLMVAEIRGTALETTAEVSSCGDTFGSDVEFTSPGDDLVDDDRLVIDPGLRSLIPPHAPEEWAALERSILDDRVREPLAVWRQQGVLLDGHARHQICRAHGLRYEVREVDLADRAAAEVWIIEHQRSRRNLTAEAASYLRGRRYNAVKGSRGGSRSRRRSRGQTVPPRADEALAAEYQVSARTIKRDGRFAEAVDALADVHGPEVRSQILCRDTGLTRTGVLRLSKLKPRECRTALEGLRTNNKVVWPKRPPAGRTGMRVPREPRALILTLHDELHFEVPEAQVDEFAAELPGLMYDPRVANFGIDVPLSVEVKSGPTWGDLKPHTPTDGARGDATTADNDQ